MQYDTGTGKFVNVDGQLVEADALRIAERISEYDENLRVICLDPNMAELNDAPFVIVCQRENGTWYKVFEAWKLDESVLERVYNADGQRFNPFAKMKDIEAVLRKAKEDRYKEQKLERIDLISSIIANPKSKFVYRDPKTGDKVTIHDNKPSERGDGRTYSYS